MFAHLCMSHMFQRCNLILTNWSVVYFKVRIKLKAVFAYKPTFVILAKTLRAPRGLWAMRCCNPLSSPPASCCSSFSSSTVQQREHGGCGWRSGGLRVETCMVPGRNVCHIALEKDSWMQVCLPLRKCGHLRPAGGDGELQGLYAALVRNG